MDRHTSHSAEQSAAERRALGIALVLNAGLAASLGLAGVLADSSALLANALDNTSDTAVYTISYYAVTRGPHWKTRAAQGSGGTLLVLSAVILVDVVRRLVRGADPVSAVMVVMGIVAATINVVCLRVLRAHRRHDVNLCAAWTFSTNDFIANIGVLAAALLVSWLDRAWPDLVVGCAIAVVAAKGGITILLDARRAARPISGHG